jgi:septal ring factor EnvC (AmiA/AmiB activator)
MKLLRFIIWSLCLAAIPLQAQTKRKDKLQLQKVRLQDEIELANKILEETRQNKEMSVGQVEALIQKIGIRERLLRTMQREIDILQEEIQEINKNITEHKEEVDRMRQEYASMIRGARRSNSSTSRLMFLLSSKDFNQAFKRLEYMKQLAEHRRRQVERISEEQKALEEDLAELELVKKEKEKLLIARGREVETMKADRSKTESAIAELRTQEKQLLDEIEVKRQQSERLEKEIQRIIEEEIKRAKEMAIRRQLEDDAESVGLKKGKDFSSKTSNAKLKEITEEKRKSLNKSKSTSSSTAYELTPEARELVANFTKNKGKLPWPVEKGIITSSFGRHPHPVAKGVIVNNNGVDIATESGSSARAVFDGEVSRVIRIPYGNKAVLIRHGNFFTVYDNLVQVFVKEGDKVSTKQEIGKVFTDPKDGKTQLHFEIWQADKVQNPQPWLFMK